MNFKSTKIHKREYFNSFLKDGDNMQAIGDYSSEKTEFVLQNNTQKHMFVSNMVIVIEENSGFKSNEIKGSGAIPQLGKRIILSVPAKHVDPVQFDIKYVL